MEILPVRGSLYFLLAVQTDFEGERESSGWTVPDMGNARILISPDAFGHGFKHGRLGFCV